MDLIRAIKICTMTSFGGEVKPSVPCHKILRHVKEPYKYKKIYFVGKIHSHLAKFLLLCYCVSLLVIAKELWWINQE
jgi:hypothetical protein